MVAKKVIEYLFCLNKVKPISALKFKIIGRGQNVDKKVLDLSTQELGKTVVDTWDYEASKKIIRDIFKKTKGIDNALII